MPQKLMNHSQEWCNWAFPKGQYNSIPPTPDLTAYNSYGGYNVTADRLAHIDGSKSTRVNGRRRG